MAILSRKITTYTQNVKDLADTPALTATQLKAFFDGRGDNELKTSINGIVDDLSATTDGASGADQIGATPVKDGGAETVQGIMEELKDVDNHINGSVNKVFTATEKTKLLGIAEGAEVNTVNSVNTKTGAVVLDADDISDTSTTNKFTTATEKSKLAGIDENANAYVHPNHSGDVTSVGDGATTIAAKAVTLAKMADMATASLLGRKTAGTGVPEVLSKADAQTLLNVEDGANNYVHPSTDGNLHVPATSTTNNGKVLKAGATAGSFAWADDTDTITTINGKTGAIAKEDITALGIPAQDTVYEHPATHSADIITDGTTNKTFTAILKSAYDGLVTLFSGISSVVTTLGADNTSIPTSKAVADAISGESCIVTVATDNSQSVSGQTITLTNISASTTETYTLGSGETSHTFKVTKNQTYKVSVDSKSGYIAPSETAEFTATSGYIRSLTLTYEIIRRYGYKRDKTNSDPAARITYLYDAVLMTPAYMNFSTGSFDEGSWGSFVEEVCRPVMLKTNGEVDYELDREDFTKKSDGVTASDVANTSYGGNVMIEFRKYRWVKRYEDAGYEYVIFSHAQYDIDYKADAFTNENDNVQPCFYWGAFKGSNIASKLRSIAGQTVMVSQTRNTEVSYAAANGEGYYTIYKSGWDHICDLLTLISKSDHGQDRFGTGRSKSTNTTPIATGTLKDQPMFKGYNDETSDVKVFGIEGFWGNVWEGMAGLVLNSGIKTKMTPPYNFDGAGYTATGITPSGTSGGYISSASVTAESGFVPKVASGSATQYYCDGLWYNNSQIDYVFVGGNWDDAGRDGPRCVCLDSLASTTRAFIGSRLSYLNPA